MNLAVAPHGDIYVGDGYGSSYVNQYDDLWMPHADRRNYRIQTFTPEGKHIGFVPGLRYPSHRPAFVPGQFVARALVPAVSTLVWTQVFPLLWPEVIRASRGPI